MKTPKTKEALFVQIESLVNEGERLLKDDHLRMQIKCSLPAAIENSFDGLYPREFMVKLTFAVLSSLPDSFLLRDFDNVIRQLPPLNALIEIDFELFIIVRDSDRVKDLRMPVDKFLNELCKYLDRDKTTEVKPESRNSESRRIWGFAPRPDDKERK